jgi:alkylation response protein AidB-like acyl-CoA dehydrogenase/predicted heme/steroid binding protein
MASAAMKSFTREEVGRHNKDGDCWLIIDNDVFDVSKFAKLHPGGIAFILDNAGKDVTKDFHLYHHPDHLRKYSPRLKIGELAEADRSKTVRPKKITPHSFGDMIPYGDPAWYQRLNSPYYKDTHRDFRAKVRAFVDAEIIPTLSEWGAKDRPPQKIYERMGELGFLACMHGPPYPAAYVTAAPPKDFDYFHELILFDEVARCGHSGAIAALTNGPAIAVSAIMRFGSAAMKQRVAPEVFSGRQYIALAISEPNAGSDVAGLACTAVRDGDDYVVNGVKKWITNGTYAEYFVTAVRTKPEGGHRGLSFLLVERKMPGFNVRKVNIRDSDISGTAYLEFVNVRVPAANLIGRENDGFKYIMHNFNHERFYITVVTARMARICLEESIKFASRRRTFGKALHEHQVIRMKIAAMARSVEQLQTWLEFMTYQMCTMSHAEANAKLGDVICLVKAQASKSMELCARETTHVFGGNALHKDSVGRKIEMMVAFVKGYAIPAGAEDVMDDFAARSVFRLAAATAKL